MIYFQIAMMPISIDTIKNFHTVVQRIVSTNDLCIALCETAPSNPTRNRFFVAWYYNGYVYNTVSYTYASYALRAARYIRDNRANMDEMIRLYGYGMQPAQAVKEQTQVTKR